VSVPILFTFLDWVLNLRRGKNGRRLPGTKCKSSPSVRKGNFQQDRKTNEPPNASSMSDPFITAQLDPGIGGNHASETVRDWEDRMGRYKKGIGAVQEDNGTDDDIVPLSLPDLSTPITPSLWYTLDIYSLRRPYLWSSKPVAIASCSNAT
jgi:hypothetical protein